MTPIERVRIASAKGYIVLEDGSVRSPRWKMLRLHPRGDDRLAFSINTEEGSVSVYVHQMVAYQKYGPDAFAEGVEVRHLNNDHKDNRPSNIKLGTHSQNMLDRPVEERVAHARKAAAVLRKLSDLEVEELRRDRAASMTYKQLRQKYGLTKSSISYILHAKTYKT